MMPRDEGRLHPVDENGGDNFGPQGAALILELQRLERAFEIETEIDRPRPQSAALGHVIRTRQPIQRPVGKRPTKRWRDGAIVEWLRIYSHLAKRRQNASRSAVDDEILEPQSYALNIASAPLHLPDRLALNDIETPRLSAGLDLQAQTSATARWSARLMEALLFLANIGSRPDGTAGETLTPRVARALDSELRTGLRVVILAAIIGGGLLALMPLAGAVVVPGNLVVESNVKSIQHPTGGIVAEIAAHNGMRVNAGDLLLRLDATQAGASLQMVSKQLDETRSRLARLVAERDGLDSPEIPAELMARIGDSGIIALLAAERLQFNARVTTRLNQKDLLNSRIGQLGEEIVGLDAQLRSKARQIELIASEMTGVQELYDKRLVPLNRLTTLQRESARIEGERGQLMSAIAETKAKVGEAELQIVRIDQEFRTDVAKELAEVRSKEAELVERGVAARDLLDRIEIRAPTSGVVHQLTAHTIGGVIRAGDTIMDIVPDFDELQVEAKLQPGDIDQIRLGQTAFIRFSAFNQRVTPQLAGTVSYVSADITRDAQTNAPYFTVRASLPERERHRLGTLQLSPGMPAEVFMQTGSRTMMSYLLKPITEQWQRAFIER
jgi:HlyD family secretion protein